MQMGRGCRREEIMRERKGQRERGREVHAGGMKGQASDMRGRGGR